MGRLGLWPYQRRTQIMGILNITPDSFSDGGRHAGVAAAVRHAKAMAAAGADIIDIGGQSTRPGSDLLTAEQEAARVLPVIQALMQEEETARMPLSIDTFYADVAAAAVEAGATMVNDVSGGTMDPRMHRQVAELGVPYVLMHMRGTPQDMQHRRHTAYSDVIADVAAELTQAASAAIAAGIEPWRLVLDPGLGFAKTHDGNVALLAGLPALRAALPPPLAHLPQLLGPSRKGFLGRLTGRQVAAERDWATAAAAALCVAGGANIIRAHNVEAVRDACRVADAARRFLP
jgi:2-amino-4-hydroxy-6-hydroxymethyldihydropteridine diphosphokinase/dihydropteroate synthase